MNPAQTVEEAAKEYAKTEWKSVEDSEPIINDEKYNAFIAGHSSRDAEVQALQNKWDCDKAALSELQRKLTAEEKEGDEKDKQVQLLQTELIRYKRLLELCKQFKTNAEKKAFDNYAAKVSVESEKDMNAILTDEVEAKDKEIERLKGLIERSHATGWVECPGEFDMNPKDIVQSWNDFKSLNNL